jgi:NADH:ubiquinone oxidoreductase subunit 4 (subunit M)
MTFFAVGRAILGTLLALFGTLTLAGRTKTTPLPRRPTGISQLGVGVFLFLTSAFPGNIWAFTTAVAAFIIGAVYLLTAFVRRAKERQEQEWLG